MVDNFKYQPGRSLPKRIWLNNSDPADGYEGSSIVYNLTASNALLSRVASVSVLHTPWLLQVVHMCCLPRHLQHISLMLTGRQQDT